MRRKQFTIIMFGNRFGDYLSETMEGYYTKWLLKYNYYKGHIGHYQLKDVRVKKISLNASEISIKDIKRTINYYNQIHKANNDLPYWLKQLINEKNLNIKELLN